MWISVWDGNPFSASWSYAPKGPGLNWCLAASGNPPPLWLKCCRIGLTFRQSPGIGKLNSYPLWLELILTADSGRLCLQQVLRCHPSSKKPSFSPSSIFFAQNCRTRNTTEDKDGLKPYTTRYEEETLWNSPNGTEAWYTLLVRGINGRRGGYTQTLLYILSYSVHQAPLYSHHVTVDQVVLPSNSMK